MSLKKIIFLKLTALIIILTLIIVGYFTHFNIKHHINDEKNTYVIRSKVLAEEFTRLILWNDRVAVKRLLNKELKADIILGYAFIKKNGEPYEYTFKNGVPASLLKIPVPPIDEPFIWEFKNTRGKIYYDISVRLKSPGSILHIGLVRSRIIEHLNQYFIISFFISFFLIVIGTIISYFLSIRMTSEINILTEAIHSYTNSDEGKKLNLKFKETEIKKIVSSFNAVIAKQKLSETALNESEKKLLKIAKEWKKTFDAIDNPIMLIDPNGRIIRCNIAQKEHLGIDFKDIVGCTTHKLLHNGVTPHECLLQKIKKTKKRESRIFKKNNSWFQCTLDPIFNDSGLIEGAVHVLEDITERKRGEEALKSSEERLKIIFESAPDAIFLSDLKGNFIDGNKTSEDMLGYKKEELIGKSFLNLKLLSAKELAKAAKALAKSVLGKKTGPDEFLLKRKDGSQIQTEIISYPVKIKNKTVVLGIARDITTRKKTEEALQLTQFSVDNSTDAVYWMGPDAEFVYVNNAAVEALQYSEEELLSMTVHDIDPGFPPEVWLAHWADLKEKKSFVIQTLHKRKDESTFPVEITVNLIQFGGREINCAIAKDITERKKAEDALRESREKYQTLFNNMTASFALHEIVVNKNNIPIDYIFVEVNDAFEDQTGLKRKEIIGKKVTEVLPGIKNDPIRWIEIYGKVALTGEGIQFENFSESLNKWYSVNAYSPIKGYFATIFEDITNRKKMEEALKKSEERYRIFVDNTSDAYYLSDMNGRFLDVNDEACSILGYTRKELLNLSISDVDVNFDPDKLSEILGSLTFNESKFVVSVHKKKEGETFPVEVLIRSFGSKEQPLLLSIARDITDRIKAEENLKESEEKFKKFFEDNQAVMMQINPETKQIISCNTACLNYYGYSKNELLSKTMDELNILPVDEIDNLMKKALKNKANFFNFIHKLANNEIRDVEVYASPIKMKNKKLMFIIVHDISERKKAEITILEQQKFIQTAINALTHPFYIIDIKNHNIVMKNLASMRFSSEKDPKCFEITHGRSTPCDGEKHPCPIIEIKKSKKPFLVEHIHTDKSGEKIIHEVHGFPIFDENGDIIQIIEYCLDITERKIAQEKSLKQQKELSRVDKLISLGILVSGVAHEINNPNNSILLNSQFLTKVWQDIIPLLDKSIKDDPSIKIGGINYKKLKQKAPDLFAGISESSKRIKFIVEDLKRYARKDSFNEYTFIDINSVIKSAVNLMRSFIKKSTNNFELNLGKNLPEIKANFQKIEQVLINIIQNSCQAVTPKSDHIKISTESDPNKSFILITIKDEGIGINPKDLKLITEPFFTTKRESGGTGLGLSVSDKIIIDHNGKLLFRSKPGEGTTVEIYLPISKKDNKL